MKSTIKKLIEGDRIEAINEEIKFTDAQLNESAKGITARYKKRGQGQPVFNKSVDVPKKTEDNAEEFNEEGRHALTFIKMPTNLRYYSYMTDYGIKDSAILMYQLIIDFYNTSKGRAFPSQYTLAMHSGKSIRSVVSTLKVLKDVGLIEIRRTGNGSNNEYRPLLPLEPVELFTRYPKALQRLIKNNAAVSEKRERDAARREQKKQANEWE